MKTNADTLTHDANERGVRGLSLIHARERVVSGEPLVSRVEWRFFV